MVVWYAGLFTLIGVIAIVIITTWIAIRHTPEAPLVEVIQRVYKIRAHYFYALVATLTVGLLFTIAFLPYPQNQKRHPDVIVSAVGYTWYWQLTPTSDKAKRLKKGAHGELILPLDKPVQFNVTSNDVNHGFGIYNTKGVLLTQTQAMPGYVNKLIYTFTKPGVYTVLCMEYCGLAHHTMLTSFKVQ